ncbi:unnamed protein product [Rangifer tarandus platyrhynchus]|uniref:Prefoldin subunit 4 n=3 Tax=Rangifer tarandus platyrhynchus TaxID=3082113 RepID=A0ABN8Y0G6_RANTA|nr:unnamed protein product [Rangifer tarandus platyrhynchus]
MLHAAPRCSLRERMPTERWPPGLEERSGELAVSCKKEDGHSTPEITPGEGWLAGVHRGCAFRASPPSPGGCRPALAQPRGRAAEVSECGQGDSGRLPGPANPRAPSKQFLPARTDLWRKLGFLHLPRSPRARAREAAGRRPGRGDVEPALRPPRVRAEGERRSPKMAATMKKAAAEDVNVTFEDQQKINKFARNTSRITELKEEIEVKKKQLQNLEDACEDIILADDDCLMVPYQIGDVFISHSQEETQEMLEEAKKNLQEEIDALESRVESIQRVLADLKVQLYAKFGSNINLEADES